MKPMKKVINASFLLSARRILSFTILCNIFSSALYAQNSQPFEEWLSELRNEALSLGVREETIVQAFSEITPPVQRIINNDRFAT